MARGTAVQPGYTLTLTRHLEAPTPLVWRAWTDPAMLRRWSCPRGFTIEVCEGELRAGGRWKCAMRAPDGTLHTAAGEYQEVSPDHRLVFTHGWLDAQGQPGHTSLVTLTLEAHGTSTCMTFVQSALASEQSREGHQGGWTEAFAKLPETLAQQAADDRTSVHTTDRDITVSRLIPAPRSRVWRAWTDPVRIVQWWGPRGFTTTTQSFDLRPGGHWQFVMHGPPPDRQDFPNYITFEEVVHEARLVYKHGGKAGSEPVNFRVTATFQDAPGGTLLTMHMTFPSREAKDFVVNNYGALEGARQNAARLEEFLTAEAPTPATFAISRTFRAPLAQVWRAWTERERLEQWFGPKGCRLTSPHLDLRVGGSFLYRMEMGPATHWARWVFEEVSPRSRLVFTVGFCDEHGNPQRNPWEPNWPLAWHSTVTFVEQDGATTVAVRWVPLRATDLEQRVFGEGRASMQQGWTGTLDQCEEYLRKG